MLDILIKKGKIVDGTNKKSFIGDIGIRDGIIVEIAEDIVEKANEYIDARGLVVSPGFIDVHSHNDLVPFMGDNIKNLKLMQGVTTELVGQCGLGVVPCVESEDDIWKNYITGVVGNPDIEWNFPNIKTYFSMIEEKGLKNNIALLISHGAIRAKVMKFQDRPATKDELIQMCSLVEDAMKSGAHGISMGLQYIPGIFTPKEELIAIGKIIKKYNGIIMVHLRNHDSSILKALDEMFEIAMESGAKLHISHMRSYNSTELGANASKLINHIEMAIEKGIEITFDEHLYLSGSTLMTQLLPPWMTEGGSEAMSKRLEDKNLIEKLRKELLNPKTYYLGWDNYSYITGWDGILITSVNKIENKEYMGKTVGEIARNLNVDPLDFALKLLVDEQFGVAVVTLNVFSEEDTIELIKHPLQMVGSDSIPAGTPHPRLYGNYPLFLGKFVRDKKAISLENAIYKITALPAKTLGLSEIGEINIGKTADVTIFDFENIMGHENYFKPTLVPKGIKYVILNGKVALKEEVVKLDCYGKIY